MVAGYSDSRMAAFDGHLNRFIAFCVEDGVIWDTAGKSTMVAYLGYLFRETAISAETATQYVSAVNRAYDLLDLPPPGRAVDSPRLYADVKSALAGFRRNRIASGASPPSPTAPTPVPLVYELLRMAARAAKPPQLNMRILRAALAHVWQYYMISRPTMTAGMLWTNVRFDGSTTVHVTITQLAAGRKNKTLPTKVITRQDVSPLPDAVHPIRLLQQYCALVDSECRRRNRPFPKQVWQLPAEPQVGREFTSVDMGHWWKLVLSKLPPASRGGATLITPKSHRSGASTAAAKLGIDVSSICHVADWDQLGTTFRTTYLRPGLACPTALTQPLFGDLR